MTFKMMSLQSNRLTIVLSYCGALPCRSLISCCLHWPYMPGVFMTLAQSAAKQTNLPTFEPDACLINHSQPGTRLTLHQDNNERSFDHPIVSVSLGIPATFLFGGEHRADPVKKCSSCTGTLLCGAVRIVGDIMGSRHSRKRLIRCLAQSVLISPSAKLSEKSSVSQRT